MTLEDSVKSFFPSSCKVTIPKPDTELHSIVSRWSDLEVSLPAAIVEPSSEEDIAAAIRFATANKLHIIPGNGGHGSFVKITDKTLYLDLKNLKHVSVGKESESVTFGGGASSGDVLKVCVEGGYYSRASTGTLSQLL